MTAKRRTAAAAIAAQRSGADERSERKTETHVAVLLTEPFEQRGNVDLVGLVIPVSVYITMFTPARKASSRWRGSPATMATSPGRRADRPGAGEIVGGDDDRRNAIAGAGRPARLPCSSLAGGNASTHNWPVSKRPGKSRSRKNVFVRT